MENLRPRPSESETTEPSRPDLNNGEDISKKRNRILLKIATLITVASSLLAAACSPEGDSDSSPVANRDKVEKVVEMDTERSKDNEKLYHFIEKYKDAALKTATEDTEKPIPYEFILAVAAHESAYGTSDKAVHANNFFGITAKDGWDGEIYEAPTKEEVDGKLVATTRKFRKYNSPEDCFKDFREKIYFKDSNGSYRYADVIKYIKEGGKDSKVIASLMNDSDEEGELRWATDSEWHIGVQKLIGQIDTISDVKDKRTDVAPKIDGSGKIVVDKIDFSGLSEESEVVNAQIEGFSSVNLERFNKYKKDGVKKIGTEGILEKIGDTPDTQAYVEKAYKEEIPKEELEYLVLHLWANGVTTVPRSLIGNSHRATLSKQVLSWYNANNQASSSYMLSDDPDSADDPDLELWQLTDSQFGGANHAGNGIMDKGKDTHEGLNNGNSIGIEVQADTIFDVSPKQYEKLVYWCTQMLIDSGKIKPGLSAEDIYQIVDKTVIGHGKNNLGDNTSGLEFGYKFTRPMIGAISEFAYQAVNAKD